ncbi:LamG-like jellyroll fold domain-containing protein [Saccharothrix australiensis]|uniref:RHS repeat-associated protein n=1 Tax=Saccharothrix australiensis TaxID=2072 RepID=A0A495VZ45_9PSEU|nr:DNRLRE domain-containing protein [Saccharothrix australiensis]RKT54494.1 RHS repeat-associated protein [Saccharothrix australiensis]
MPVFRSRSNAFLPAPVPPTRRWTALLLAVALVVGVFGPELGRLWPRYAEVAAPASGPAQRWGSADGLPHEDGDGKGNTADPVSLQSQYPPVEGQADPAPAANAVEVVDPVPQVRGFDQATSTEIPELRGRSQRTFRNGDGTQTTEFSEVPVNYRAADGSWQPVDPAFVPKEKGEGWRNNADQVSIVAAPRAAASGVVRAALDDGHAIEFGVADAAEVPGEVSGNSVTYRGVRPDADLTVTSEPGLLKEVVRLNTPNAPRSWLFPLTLTGLTAERVDGGVLLHDEKGVRRAHIPDGFMTDASPPDESGAVPTSYGVTYELVRHDGKPALRMDLDAAWLDDPARAYPVSVDPPVDMRAAASSMYVQRDNNGNNFSRVDGDLKVGRSSVSTAASYLSFPGVEDALRNHKIFGANLSLLNYQSSSCSARPITVHPVVVPWTANNSHKYPGPAVGDALASSSFAHGYIASGSTKSRCPSTTETVALGDDGRDLVQRWVTGAQANHGLSVRGSETDPKSWKVFTGAGTANPPRLAVTHTPYNASYKFLRPVPEPPVTRTRAGKVRIEVTNLGAEKWTPGIYALAYRYFGANGQYLGWSESAALPSVVERGGTVELDATINATPPGSYRFEFTMIKRGVAFFTDEQIPPAALAFQVIDVPPVIKEQYPPNGYSAPTLTPSLWARALDVDAPPNGSLQYRFEVCDSDKRNCFDSGRLAKATWTIPHGKLFWSRSYLWRAFAFDGASENEKLPFSTLLTAVPQPEITAHLGNAPYGGRSTDVDPQVGNYTTGAVDASLGTPGPSLTVARTYNSLDPRRDNAFGAGWSTVYDMRVTPDGDGSGNVVVSYPDGQQVRFGANKDGSGNPVGGRLAPPQGRYATLVPQPEGGWTLADKNGTTYVFGGDGRLTGIIDRAQRHQELTYTGGRLAAATDRANGRKLEFTWQGDHVASVTAGGSTWNYTYEGDRLTSVCDPDDGCTRYSHTAGSHYRSTVLDAKPDAYWRLGDRGGDNAVSQIGINLGADKARLTDVALGGEGALSGTDDKAAGFNGGSSVMRLPDGLVRRTRELTVELWFKTTTGGPLLGAQLKPLGENDNPTSATLLEVGADGKLTGRFPGVIPFPPPSAGPVNDGRWHHVVLTGSLTTQTLYLDGQQVSTRAGVIDTSEMAYSQIGAAFSGGTRKWFAGQVDEVAVYQHPLGAPAVRDHFRAREATDHVAEVKLPSGRVAARLDYDTAADRVREYVDHNGGTWKLSVPAVSGPPTNIIRTVRLTDPANRAHYYDFDPLRGRIVRYLAPLGTSTRPEDLPPTTTATRPPPSCTTPPPGEPVFCDVPTDGGPGSFPPVEAQGARSYHYDANGFQSTIADENGNTVTLVQDDRGNIRSRKTCRTGPTDCQTAHFEYYNSDNLTDPRLDKLISARDPRSASATDTTYRTLYTYTSRGDLESQTTPDGAVVRHTYTTATTPAFGGGSTPAGLVHTSTDARNAQTVYSYFRNGDLAEVRTPSGFATRFTYDALGRRTSSTQISTAHPGGVTTTYTYDKLSRRTSVTTAATTNAVTGARQQSRTTTAYDVDGRPERVQLEDLTGGAVTRSSTVEHDDRGRVALTRNAEGHETSYRYDVFGNLTSMVNAAGVNFEYAYTARNKLAEVRVKGWNSDPGDAPPTEQLVLASYAYDLAGRLVRETDAMGRATRYRYYSDDLLRQVVAAGSREIVLEDNTYDAAGHLTRSTQAGERVSAFEYDATGRLTATTADPAGLKRRSVLSYDPNGNVTKVVRTGNESNTGVLDDGVSETTEFGYDQAGRQTSQTVWLGADRLVTNYGYDQRGLLTSSTDPRAGDAHTSLFGYDELGRLVTASTPPVTAERLGAQPETKRAVTTLGYDVSGSVVDARDAAGRTTHVDHDKLGRQVATHLPDYTPPGATEPIKAVWRTAYDELGNVTETTDPRGAVSRFTYDQLGRLVSSVAPKWDVPGEAGGTTAYTYTRVGELLAVTGPTGARTERTYDEFGRMDTLSVLERKPTPGTYTTRFSYRDTGELATTTSPGGVVDKIDYDAAGDPITFTSGAGVRTRLGYDRAGRPVKSVDGLGRTRRVQYDQAGRAVKSLDIAPTGGLLRQTATGYDRAGNAISHTDPEQRVTEVAVDALGRVTRQTEPVAAGESLTTSFGYDIVGNPTRFTNGREHSTWTTFTSWDLPESVVEPSTTAHPAPGDRTWTTSYDAAGNPVSTVAPGGVRRDRTFDLLGLLRAETAPDTAERVLDYDDLGRLVRAGGNTFSYDDRGALLDTAGPSGASSFRYNGDGDLLSRADASGTSAFTYLDGRLKTLRDGITGTVQTLGYDEAGALSTVDYGGRGVRRFDYDELGRLKTDAVGTAASTAYGYDLADRLTGKTTTGVAGAGTQTYGYDFAGRLTSWNGVAYGWDAAGNRTRVGDKTAQYDERDRLLTDGASSYTYTPRGTRATKTTGTTVVPFAFDGFDRMTAQGATHYTYDALDRVATRDATGFSYSGPGNDLASDGSATFSRDPSGEVIALASGADQRLTVADAHGDVVGGFDPATGPTALADSASYDPFGAVTAVGGAKRPLGFQGDHTDPETGQVNMGARWYDPASGAFDSRDDASLPTSPSAMANRYGYGSSSPVNFTDPSGHNSLPPGWTCTPSWWDPFSGNQSADCHMTPPSDDGGVGGSTCGGGGVDPRIQTRAPRCCSGGTASKASNGCAGSSTTTMKGGKGTSMKGGKAGGKGGGRKNATKPKPKPDPAIAARKEARNSARTNPRPIPQAMRTPLYGSTYTPPVSSAPHAWSHEVGDYQEPVDDVNESYRRLQRSLTVDPGTLLGKVADTVAAPSEITATNAANKFRMDPESGAGQRHNREDFPTQEEYEQYWGEKNGCVDNGTWDRTGPECDPPNPADTARQNRAVGDFLMMLLGVDDISACFEDGSIEGCLWSAMAIIPGGKLAKGAKLGELSGDAAHLGDAGRHMVGNSGKLALPFHDPALRDQVRSVVEHFDKFGTPPAGVLQGGSRRGDGIYRGGGLPPKSDKYYVETDVWPTKPGEHRKSGRLVMGALGEVYYTNHYDDGFALIRSGY